MTGTRPAYITFEELYTEPTNNPFGTSDGDIINGIAGINAGCRLASQPPNAKEVHLDFLADFAAPVGAVGVFAQGGGSPTG
jgi:hypothetical protein